MRLYVYVLQAKDLPIQGTYVKLQLGRLKSKTKTPANTWNPVWNEEFVFRVHDVVGEQLVASVFHVEHDSAFFNGSKCLLGLVSVPLSLVADQHNQTLPPTWFPLHKYKTGNFITKDSGKILLTLSLHGKGHDHSNNHLLLAQSDVPRDDDEFESTYKLSQDIISAKAPCLKFTKGLVKTIAGRVDKLFHKNKDVSRMDDSPLDFSSALSDHEEEHSSNCSFEEAMELMQLEHDKDDIPENLDGGVLVDQMYIVSPCDLNKFLFAPDSQFIKDMAQLQGTTDVEVGPWKWKSEDVSRLTRVITYTKAATKLVKAVKATEEQTYIKANGHEYVILVTVSTPDVPYGSTFKIELLYKIMPGPEVPTEEESSHLIVSWRVHFQQSTMMQSMIEGGAKKGLKESFDQFSDLLAQNLKILNPMELSDRDHMLSALETEHQSDWKLAIEYFGNFTVVFTIFAVLYFMLHVLLCHSSEIQGLEIDGLDLPDSFEELLTSGILVMLLQHVYNMVSHFIHARLKRGNDHGIKAQGDGWVLTVALIEGVNLASLNSAESLDPYVVFTCNGKTRTSSVKLQTHDPQWNEILEFDAMEEPPSVLDVEVFDSDGPFDQAASLGHCEINLLKHTPSELSDLWVSLEGKLAQPSQSKLHLRIFLDNNKGVQAIKEYLTKMEKEVGKKLNLRSPHKNSTFQKLFSLPPEEFLINDFTCQLKRKLPVQGRLFLSARIVGFSANLFGHKTKFFFLWGDIEDIQVLPPSLASVVSPSLVIVLGKGRGLDARHGAKSQDEEGRLRFHFQSFVSFNDACRTIMALWRTRTFTTDQRAEIAEEQQEQEERPLVLEEVGSILHAEDIEMSRIYTAELPICITSLMEIFDGGQLEHKIMEKSGCLNYVPTTWEQVKSKSGVYERRVSYKFNRQVSIFGGEVTCTQQKCPTANGEGWIVNEVMRLRDVPFSDEFRVKLRYQIEKSSLAQNACKCDAHIGIVWLKVKSTNFQLRITRNVTDKFIHRVKERFELLEREILFGSCNSTR
ncbi:LOW QUALITY PROTEIN: C2 and GRAM domain-containing protein At5g50170-like [Hibiscus syriacus]|uniref:LOW QUALITY PROTEIN: C2 and GRAM domain-containing protein At5g50170-like n=1 Tax=Hibiscus syriacus TaxID=106335 RepID=UPI0019234EB8|nr:LOW QUALITY PROTEIN: C2 and GRAM domain-containing protein At5g50170-like [Hibiscus syriacus]